MASWAQEWYNQKTSWDLADAVTISLSSPDAMVINFTLELNSLPTTVIFNDTNLEAAVRVALNKPTGDITSPDMASLTSLYADDIGILDLTGLEYAINLQVLTLITNQINDISALAGLTNLQTLQLGSNQISDISILAGLTSLQTLTLYNNQISDISPLAVLTSLKTLNIDAAQISDIGTMAGSDQPNSLALDTTKSATSMLWRG